MPVRLSSRYATVPTYDAPDAEGVTHPTIGIRPNHLLPAETVVYNHLAIGAESLEYLAWRFFGSSATWWQLADTNPLVFPLDLPSGSVVAIAGPGEVGLIQRTRRF